MSNYGFRVNAKIINADATSGALDDLEVIGGVKIVQRKGYLNTLTGIETYASEEADSPEWQNRKHILKNGSLAFVVEEGLFYRWNVDDADIYVDENGTEHATKGHWTTEDKRPVLNEDGVLVGYREIECDGLSRDVLNLEVGKIEAKIADANNYAILEANTRIGNVKSAISGSLNNFQAGVDSKITSAVNTAVNTTVASTAVNTATSNVNTALNNAVNTTVNTAVNTAVNYTIPSMVESLVNTTADNIVAAAVEDCYNDIAEKVGDLKNEIVGYTDGKVGNSRTKIDHYLTIRVKELISEITNNKTNIPSTSESNKNYKIIFDESTGTVKYIYSTGGDVHLGRTSSTTISSLTDLRDLDNLSIDSNGKVWNFTTTGRGYIYICIPSSKSISVTEGGLRVELEDCGTFTHEDIEYSAYRTFSFQEADTRSWLVTVY